MTQQQQMNDGVEDSSLVKDLGIQTEHPGRLGNEDSPFVIKPKTEGESQEASWSEFLKFEPTAEKSMSLARMPLEVAMAYGEMQSDIMFALIGAVDPKADAAVQMAAYHARDGVPFDTAAKIAGMQPDPTAQAGGLFSMFSGMRRASKGNPQSG